MIPLLSDAVTEALVPTMHLLQILMWVWLLSCATVCTFAVRRLLRKDTP